MKNKRGGGGGVLVGLCICARQREEGGAHAPDSLTFYCFYRKIVLQYRVE